VANFIPDQVLDQIRQANDVVEVIGSYFPLKRAGANFRALCPFHKEKTPSFNVHPQKQIWHCFGCGTGGDVFSFVMKYENLDFTSAVRRLAERAGIRIETELGPAGRAVRDQKDLLYRLHEQVADWFHQMLTRQDAAGPARAYIQKRKITAQTVRNWRLGYAPEAWDSLLTWARSKRFEPALLETAGLVVRSDTERGERRVYDRFRGRLMIPIADEQGRIVGFSGRILTDAKDQPKYVNSPETPIFQKGRLLFGLDKARRAILDEKCVILCEGQLDTITCHEAGLCNVVAPQGTALTEQHARALKRYTDEVVLMFDSDSAGQTAMARASEPLLGAGLVIRAAFLPQGHDPDSFIKEKGVESLKIVVTKSPSFFVYYLERLTKLHDAGSERGKLEIARQMLEVISKLPEGVLRSGYVRETARRIDVPEQVLLAELKKTGPRRREVDDDIGTGARIRARTPGSAAEELLLQLMLADDRVIEQVAGRLDVAWLGGGVEAGLVRRILEKFTANAWNGPASIMNDAIEPGSAEALARLLMQPLPQRDHSRAASDCLGALERNWLDTQLGRVRNRLGQAGLEPSETVTLQKEVLDLRRRLDQIAPFCAPNM
jgi:DNA primase